jgi:hypothetical protein
MIGVLSENSCAGRAARELERGHFREQMPTSRSNPGARDVRELEREHFRAEVLTSRSIPGAGSAAGARRSHTGSPAAAAKPKSITFSRLPRRTQLADRRLRRW